MKTKNYQITLATKIEELYSVGRTYQKRLNRLGVFNVRDLLLYFPARYDDLSSVRPLVEARPGESATFKGKVLNIATRRAKNRRTIITEAAISDDTSTLKVIFFNQPFLSRLLKIGDNLVLAGKIDYKPYFGKYLANPSFEKSKPTSQESNYVADQ